MKMSREVPAPRAPGVRAVSTRVTTTRQPRVLRPNAPPVSAISAPDRRAKMAFTVVAHVVVMLVALRLGSLVCAAVVAPKRAPAKASRHAPLPLAALMSQSAYAEEAPAARAGAAPGAPIAGGFGCTPEGMLAQMPKGRVVASRLDDPDAIEDKTVGKALPLSERKRKTESIEEFQKALAVQQRAIRAGGR